MIADQWRGDNSYQIYILFYIGGKLQWRSEMYVDSESCFVVFDFLQILYVPFTLANYTLLYHQSVRFPLINSIPPIPYLILQYPSNLSCGV